MSTRPFNVDLLAHRADVMRSTLTQNDVMTQDESWKPVWLRLKCRIEPVRAREQVWIKREGVEITHTMRARVAPGLTILEKDRVVGRRSPFNGTTFEVKGVINSLGRGELLEVDLLERK